MFFGAYLIIFCVIQASAIHDGRETADNYANEWIVHIQSESIQAADDLAFQLGYENLGEVSA